MSDQNNGNAQPVQQRAGGGPAVTKGTLKTAKRLLNYVFSKLWVFVRKDVQQ